MAFNTESCSRIPELTSRTFYFSPHRTVSLIYQWKILNFFSGLVYTFILNKNCVLQDSLWLLLEGPFEGWPARSSRPWRGQIDLWYHWSQHWLKWAWSRRSCRKNKPTNTFPLLKLLHLNLEICHDDLTEMILGIFFPIFIQLYEVNLSMSILHLSQQRHNWKNPEWSIKIKWRHSVVYFGWALEG